MALHLVRHAKAGNPRDGANGEDELRPLTKSGRAQAAALADALDAWPVRRVLTSRYTRCVETIEPAATRLGLVPEHHDALAEEAALEATWALLEQLAADGIDAVVCSHGNVLSSVLDRVHRRGVEVEADEWSCRKGSIWRLETDASGTFTRAVLAVPGT